MSVQQEPTQGNSTNAGRNPEQELGERSELVDDLAGRAHETVDVVADKVSALQRSAESKTSELSERGEQAAELTKAEFDKHRANVERYARENPLTAAGIAFAAGLVISSLLRR